MDVWWKPHTFRENQVRLHWKCCHSCVCFVAIMCFSAQSVHCFTVSECNECFGICGDSCRGSVRICWERLAEQEVKRWTCQGWKCGFAHAASWPAILEGGGERAVPRLLHEQMLGRSSLRQSFWLTDPALLPLQIRISYVTRIYLSLKLGSCTALP